MKRKMWTQEEENLVMKHYPYMQTIRLAKMLDRSYSSLNGRAHLLGLKKSDQFMQSTSSGRQNVLKNIDTRFKKGQAAWNKGKKMDPETYKKVCGTMFRKGNKPHNTKYDGYLSTRQGYKYIRLAEGNWVELHRHLWEIHNGEIPEGMAVVFKDNNIQNCVIENLELITREELMIRNTIHRYPQELKQTIRALGKLKRIIKNYEKQN